MDKLQKAISKWCDDNGGGVFVGSFMTFDKDGEVNDKESLIFGYGHKDLVKISLEELEEQVAKDKEEFINW